MSGKIEPCPWCRKDAAPARSWASYVQCLNADCEASGPVMPTLDVAIAAWNEAAGLRAEVDRLVAEKRSLLDRIERDGARYCEIIDALKDHGLDARGVAVLKAEHDHMLRALVEAQVNTRNPVVFAEKGSPA